MADGLHYKPDDEGSSSGVSDAFRRSVETAFPDDDWDDERLSAFKEAIHICYEEAEGGEDMADEGKEPDHASTLALLFGKPKK